MSFTSMEVDNDGIASFKSLLVIIFWNVEVEDDVALLLRY
jgi:hypothetical protein